MGRCAWLPTVDGAGTVSKRPRRGHGHQLARRREHVTRLPDGTWRCMASGAAIRIATSRGADGQQRRWRRNFRSLMKKFNFNGYPRLCPLTAVAYLMKTLIIHYIVCTRGTNNVHQSTAQCAFMHFFRPSKGLIDAWQPDCFSLFCSSQLQQHCRYIFL